jgi:translation initiation factor eIF-2B subunit delta
VDDVSEELTRRIEMLRADRTAGASGVVVKAMAILSDARRLKQDLPTVARAVCLAQPTMAPIWNAAIAAISADPDALYRFAERIRRAPATLARYVTAHFSGDSGRPLRVVTLSNSSSVVTALEAVRAMRPLHVSCAEGRPALEGRLLAAQLSAAGISVAYFADAALAHALADADAVFVGADAIAPAWFLNKSGTRMLLAAAAQQGVPTYVVATRDKFVSLSVASRLVIRSGDPDEIWDAPPPNVEVRNPYFEATPLDLVASVISDIGILGAGMIPEVCASMPAVPSAFDL